MSNGGRTRRNDNQQSDVRTLTQYDRSSEQGTTDPLTPGEIVSPLNDNSERSVGESGRTSSSTTDFTPDADLARGPAVLHETCATSRFPTRPMQTPVYVAPDPGSILPLYFQQACIEQSNGGSYYPLLEGDIIRSNSEDVLRQQFPQAGLQQSNGGSYYPLVEGDIINSNARDMLSQQLPQAAL